MSKPSLPTSGDAAPSRVAGLIDSTVTTSIERLPVSLTSANQSAGGDTTYPPGWQGVGSHRDGDTLLTPGGFTLAAGQTPLLVAGGADGASATEGSRVARPLRIHEGGAQLVLPGSAYSAAAAFQHPLMAVGGVLAVGNAQTNLTATTTLASNFAYMTDLLIICQVVGVGAQTFTLLDASGGTVRWGFNTVAQAVGFTVNFKFSVPPRSSAAGGAFFITTTGTGSTWSFSCNGYFSVAV